MNAAPTAARAARKLRVLVFSTLYPSSARPGHGIFIETRLRKLLDSGQVEAKVVAPVPWFYSTDERHGERARMARTPSAETWHGIDVRHPRYLLPPRVGQNLAPFVLAAGAAPALRALVSEGFDFDLIDAHYYYPDGVAAALMARYFGRPLVISARGSDLNVLGTYPFARRLMRWASRQARASVGVSAALVQLLRQWGVAPERLHVLRNGVDLQQFTPVDRQMARMQLELDGDPVLLSVGNLVALKGHDLTIESLAQLSKRYPRAQLYIVGEGPLRASLQALARARGIESRVSFVGRVPHEQLAPWYSASDAMVLASRSEGMANVLLEALACGTPVVATDVGGAAEVMSRACAGRLVESGDASSLALAIDGLLSGPPDRREVRNLAEGFGWQATTAAQLQLFRQLVVPRC